MPFWVVYRAHLRMSALGELRNKIRGPIRGSGHFENRLEMLLEGC